MSVKTHRLSISLFFMLIVILAAGCSPERAEVDQVKFDRINSYLSQILPALDEAIFDFDLWSKDIGDPEKKEWLHMNAKRIEEINQRYLTPDFADYAEIETWVVPVEDGENNQWNIEGPELSAALRQLLPAVKEAVFLIEQIYQTGDQLLLAEKREQLRIVLDRALEAADLLRKIFRR